MQGKRESLKCAATILVLTALSAPQQAAPQKEDPFNEHLPGIEVKDQSIIDGVAMLSHSASLAVSVEYPLGATISRPAPKPKTVTAEVGPGTASQLLDNLCELDPTFTWERNGNMVNVLPRSIHDDPRYLLNRPVSKVSFQEVQNATDAVMKLVDQLPGPREQVAILQVGSPLNFAQPWSVTLKDLNVRQVIDEIARRLGSSFGWQFSGALINKQIEGGYWKRHGIRKQMVIPFSQNGSQGSANGDRLPWVTVRDAISDLPAPAVEGESATMNQ
jgi:hypothetical protein